MIGCMNWRNLSRIAEVSVIFLAGLPIVPAPLLAGPAVQMSIVTQSTPELNIRVYGFKGLSNSLVRQAEDEAARKLSPIALNLKWINCAFSVPNSECESAETANHLTVRIVPVVLSPATSQALGLAAWEGDDAAAFIFYDRVLARRTQKTGLAAMLGRVMAHEIAHLLLGPQSHTEIGLMRGQWTDEDLRYSTSESLGLSKQSLQYVQQEARRRVEIARNTVK